MTTRFAERGVTAIDNVLIDHCGKTIEDIGYFWDHAGHRSKIAHLSGLNLSATHRRYQRRLLVWGGSRSAAT